MMWFYLSAGAASYSSEYTYLESLSNPALITKPYIVDGETYGIRENPSYYARLDVYRQINSSWTFYYKPFADYPEQALDGYKCRSLLYLYDENKVTVASTDPIFLRYKYENRKINGKWRIHDKLISTDKYKNYKNYLITILGKFELKNGYVENFNLIGADVDGVGVGYTFISFGSISIGDSETYNNTYNVPEFYKDMLVDFGDTPQDVPSFLYDFIEFNFDRVYENQYTIYNENSVQVAQSEPEQPSIIKTNLVNAVDSYQLSLTRADYIVITLTWSNPTPEGKVFKGLSIEPNSSEIVIPVGEREVLIEKSTNFYMVYGEYTPPPVPPDPPPLPTYEESQLPRPTERHLPEGAYNANCYTNTAEANRVDKTNYLTPVRTIQGVLREPTSVTDMVMTIQHPHYPDFNYIIIPELKRYYFVNDITIINANLYELDLSVDPLMSYKDAILGLTAFVDRNEFLSNPRIIDKKRVVEQGVDIEVDGVANQVFDEVFNPETSVRFVMNGYKLLIKPGT